MIEIFKNRKNNSKNQKESFREIKMGVTELVFQLNYFKGKISAILKRHCCHSNDSYVSFPQNF